MSRFNATAFYFPSFFFLTDRTLDSMWSKVGRRLRRRGRVDGIAKRFKCTLEPYNAILTGSRDFRKEQFIKALRARTYERPSARAINVRRERRSRYSIIPDSPSSREFRGVDVVPAHIECSSIRVKRGKEWDQQVTNRPRHRARGKLANLRYLTSAELGSSVSLFLLSDPKS